MAINILTKIFGSRNERVLKQSRALVSQINSQEDGLGSLTDAELQGKTIEFKSRIAAGATLDSLLVEAFAVVREGSKRVFGLRHFDVQLMGGISLHAGKISEMGTGEGKTLTATLPVYLNALSGAGVHVVTVNDYLAGRDAQTMARLFNFLGLSVGVNLPSLTPDDKRAAYSSDITYGTNNEYGFDYLRDNMVTQASERVQRKLSYAIIDEVDSILIDEARTPLIISGQAEDHTATYIAINGLVPQLTLQIEEGGAKTRADRVIIKAGDFTIDEKERLVVLTEQGHERAELLLHALGLIPEGATLYDPSNIALMHHLNAALRANHLFNRDQHYVVQEGEVIIVDEFTGRLMAGRRWGDGLHQAVEAKEGVSVQPENQTMASITFQNFFRLYEKLAGMTGTADTEAFEFHEIYGLETIVVPPNAPSKRNDELDRIYKTTGEKYAAAMEDILECYGRGQPVLVGTTSIENSEIISKLLLKAGLPHQVLNAKQHASEADVVAQAGRLQMITIATNMAGRGTDIVLGGSIAQDMARISEDSEMTPEQKMAQIADLRAAWKAEYDRVAALGGLRIIATERHESRRIDNQLRGRSGRQGDPGSSRFYLSLDDSLLRVFAGDRVKAVLERIEIAEGQAIESSLVSRGIAGAQRKVETQNFDMRKQLLEYDDVSSDQRKVMYTLRNNVLDAVDLTAQMESLRDGCFRDLVRQYVPDESMEEQWQLAALERVLAADWHVVVPLQAYVQASTSVTATDLAERVCEAAHSAYAAKVEVGGVENFLLYSRAVLLQSIDEHWREHLSSLDYLRKGIHLRSIAQKQPKQEYKREAFELFGQMLDYVKADVTQRLMTVRVQQAE